jgi:ABC-2 type transport system permease protein
MTAFTGTWRLVRLALRRDRVQLPIWLVSLILIEAATVSSIVGLYPDE